MNVQLILAISLLIASAFNLPNCFAQSEEEVIEALDVIDRDFAEVQLTEEDIANIEGDFAAFESTEATLTIASPHPALFDDAKVDGFDYLEASVEVEEKAASVSWAPLLLTNTYYPVLSETRIKIGTKDDVTSLGISVQYNPFNVRGPRGISIQPPNVGPTQQAALTEIQAKRIKRLEDQAKAELVRGKATSCADTLEFLKSLIPSDITATLSESGFSDLKCALVIAEEKIAELNNQIGQESSQAQKKALTDQKSSWTNAHLNGIGYAERKCIEDNVSHAVASNIDTCVLSALNSIRAEIATLTATVAKADAKRSETLYLGYRKRLLSGYLPVVNLSHVTSFFEVIGEGNFDSDGDGNNDNEHSVKSRVTSLSAEWRFNEDNQISLLISESEERESAAAGMPEVDYNGFGATWTHRLMILNEDGFTKTKDYKESLFIPSINAGIAYEYKDCDSPDSDCIDGVLRTEAITPFLEFKINKKAQFRIGVPFKKSRNFIAGMEEDEDTVEIRALIAFQLGAPK